VSKCPGALHSFQFHVSIQAAGGGESPVVQSLECSKTKVAMMWATITNKAIEWVVFHEINQSTIVYAVKHFIGLCKPYLDH